MHFRLCFFWIILVSLKISLITIDAIAFSDGIGYAVHEKLTLNKYSVDLIMLKK